MRDILWPKYQIAKFTPATISASSVNKGFSWPLPVSARQSSPLRSAASTIPLPVLLFVLNVKAIFMSWTISANQDLLLLRIVQSKHSTMILVMFVEVDLFLLLISWNVYQKYSTVSLILLTTSLLLVSSVKTNTISVVILVLWERRPTVKYTLLLLFVLFVTINIIGTVLYVNNTIL